VSDVFLTLGPEGFGSYEVDFSFSPPRLTRTDTDADHTLVPGFVDIHIHGAFGIDFMEATSQEMDLLCFKLAEQGYESFLPTTVTASLADVRKALKNLPDNPMIAGFHLEGPFISPQHPGAQPPASIVDPNTAQEEWREVLEDERLKVVTLAPEVPGALDLTKFLTQHGVVVSMGHTDATFEQARAGYEAGAQHTTHTFNAMRGLHHREAGAVGYALVNDAVRCELIYDRVHVSKPAAELLVRSKPAGGLIAVSDSSKATGLAAGEKLTMWGHECVTRPGEVRLASSGALAGSAITLLDAFRNLAADFGAEVAIRACSLNPRAALRRLAPPTAYVLFDPQYEIVDRQKLSASPAR